MIVIFFNCPQRAEHTKLMFSLSDLNLREHLLPKKSYISILMPTWYLPTHKKNPPC